MIRPAANERRTVGRLCRWLKGEGALTRLTLALKSRAMAMRDILIIPDKRLRLKSEPVKAVDKAMRALVDDMFETMYAAPGIGLAAIQIGVPQRVVTMDLAKKDEPKAAAGVHQSRSRLGRRTRRRPTRRAACRSRNITRRSSGRTQVKVKFLDLDGKPQEIEADGLLATCLQHEIDHINGVLFIDHISKLKRDMRDEEIQEGGEEAERQAAAGQDLASYR